MFVRFLQEIVLTRLVRKFEDKCYIT